MSRSVAIGAAAVALVVLAATPHRGFAQSRYPGRDPSECAGLSSGSVTVVPYQLRRDDRGCARIARHHFHDRRRHDLIHQYNPDLGPAPHRFTPGTYICLPSADATPEDGPPAQVTALRQNVRHRTGERAAWNPASLGQGIQRGTRVSTLEEAFAELTFRDQTVVTLRADTLVVVYGDTSGSVRRTGSEAVLERGSLRTRLASLRRGERFEVSTPSSRIALGEGAAVTSVDASSATRVSNHEGEAASVRGSQGGAPVRLPPGMGSKVLRGRRPSPPRPLPAAPRWTAAQTARFVGVGGLTTARGGWEPVEAARVYRVEVSRQPDGSDVAAQVEVPNEVTRFELHRFPPGTYYARVSTIDGDFFESRPSDVWAFEVFLADLQLPGGDEGPEPGFEFVEHEVQPLAIPRGSRIRPPEPFRCAFGESTPRRELEALEMGDTELRCVDDAGEAVGAIAVRVTGATLTVEGAADAAAPLQMVRGSRLEARLILESNLEIPPDARFSAGDEIEIIDVQRHGSTYTLELRASVRAPHLAQLTLGANGTPLAELAIETRSAGEAPPPPDPEPAPPPRIPWTQALGTTQFASVIGLRDVGRAGVGGWVSGAYFGPADGGERVRISAGVRASLFGRQLQLEVAGAYDPLGQHPRTAQRASGDLQGAAAYRVPLEGIDLAFEVGALFPTAQTSGSLSDVRLVPSVHFGIEAAEILLLRTRQGAIVGLSSQGDASWASAYGFDVRPVEWLTLGTELDLTLGQEDADLVALPLLGASVGLTLDVFVVSAAARFSLTDEARDLLGRYSLFLTVEAGYWLSLL